MPRLENPNTRVGSVTVRRLAMKFHSVLTSGTYIIPCLSEIFKKMLELNWFHMVLYAIFYSRHLFSEHAIMTIVNWNLLLLLWMKYGSKIQLDLFESVWAKTVLVESRTECMWKENFLLLKLAGSLNQLFFCMFTHLPFFCSKKNNAISLCCHLLCHNNECRYSNIVRQNRLSFSCSVVAKQTILY